MSNRKHRDNQEICARKVRELAQSGVNKHCFECGQPGVTYIDITVGCFVCTSCSGILRGLNPPHRVKSISMTTFTQQEVEFLQNHGNEVGKRTWLCAYDPKTDGCFDTRDAQRLKEFLQDKYEKKKWHFSKNKNWREAEGPFSPGGQGLSPPHPRAPGQLSSGPPTRTLSQSHLASWDKAPGPSPADLRTDVFTARPSRSQSLRDPSVKDTILCGIGRQRPSTILPGMAPQSHGPPFPALPRPSGRSTSSSGGSIPFKAIPKSLSVDSGGLSQHMGLNPSLAAPVSQDRYAALSQLDSVFSDSSSPVTAPSGGFTQGSTLFGNRLSSSSTPASSPGITDPVSSPHVFSSFPTPFSTSTGPQASLSPSNPFSTTLAGDSVRGAPAAFPQSVSFPAASGRNVFAPQSTSTQEANGLASVPAPESCPRPARPVSVNPFTGSVYPRKAASRNPFI
ncbi:arf-GAP domain and FG repeat-containing protein 2 isoform X2 [Paramormyrops kingsleyae]|uniref:arf-GAP domain and FG repeat-containing protein 2 isoform X2 n=1 Tax=Paramormyrops kingsleyae TaxID=1676925 RepID=UPI000CD65B31|nr:arf-GAP domain and FG repeat-containing protein 2-like isoform X2 [Paramormyrops kingsleyae]